MVRGCSSHRRGGSDTTLELSARAGRVKVAPALADGCTMVLKAAPETALDAMVFGDAAIYAGLPPGVLNVIARGARRPGHIWWRTPVSTGWPSPDPPIQEDLQEDGHQDAQARRLTVGISQHPQIREYLFDARSPRPAISRCVCPHGWRIEGLGLVTLDAALIGPSTELRPPRAAFLNGVSGCSYVGFSSWKSVAEGDREGIVVPGRGGGIAAASYSRAARRNRRAFLNAPGSPDGIPLAVLGRENGLVMWLSWWR